MSAIYIRDLQAILRKVGTGILVGTSMVLVGCPPKPNPNPQPVPPNPNPTNPSAFAVTTYHYDTRRLGWNSKEVQLNYSNVNSSSLKVLVVKLDDVNDQVDTQPLIVPNLQIAGGTHDVVYVTTENNSIYAFDANTGARLKMVNLGPAVPKPQGCYTNGPAVGIDGTPVIDLPSDTSSGTMYVITYTPDSSNNPAYFIHALDLANLTDKVKAQPISAKQKLTDGTTFNFNPAWQRQRTGLLLANGNIYAGFGSICDGGGPLSRGWVLGWKAGSLSSLSASLLTNTLPSDNGVFLSGVWMSGYGIAADQNGGNIYFSTGNSDPSGTRSDEVANPSDSVLSVNPDLTRPSPTAKFTFTPANVATLDQGDWDLSAGGVMLLPPQSGPVPNMVIAATKDGRMFLLNRDNLGGFSPSDSGAIQAISIGNCWCGPSYFNDGSPHVVSSGANTLGLWDLQTSPTLILKQSASAPMPTSIQQWIPSGFFTTVSSNGNNNAIIWAVSRPQNTQNPTISLYAFKATPSGNTLPPLFQSVAGSWPSTQANANIVPVVANGKVYVASYKELDIFGLGLPGVQAAQKVKTRAKALVQIQGAQLVKGPEEHQVSGTVLKVDGNRLTIQTRDNKTVEVDATEARRLYRYPAVIPAGGSVVAAGPYDAHGVLQAVFVWGLKPPPASWPPDR